MDNARKRVGVTLKEPYVDDVDALTLPQAGTLFEAAKVCLCLALIDVLLLLFLIVLLRCCCRFAE